VLFTVEVSVELDYHNAEYSHWVVLGLPTIKTQAAVRAGHAIFILGTGIVDPSSFDHLLLSEMNARILKGDTCLFDFALPALLFLVRPGLLKGRFARLQQLL
jgi:hypothetical protein